MKTTGQLLPDRFRIATFDPGCRFQMALGVKREWKKRNDGGKDYAGHPEAPHMHETHDVLKSRGQLSENAHSPAASKDFRRRSRCLYRDRSVRGSYSSKMHLRSAHPPAYLNLPRVTPSVG
jgi:hypothetical protein